MKRIRDYDIDFTDADFVEIYNNAQKNFEKKDNELKDKTFSPAESIRQECKLVREFFDCIFGEGANIEILGSKNSLKNCIKSLEELNEIKNEQELYIENKLTKYSPERIKR